MDVRPALIAAKSSGILYYRTDTHWNDWGAFIAYQQIIAQVQKLLPQWHIVAQTRDDFAAGKSAPWPARPDSKFAPKIYSRSASESRYRRKTATMPNNC